MFEPLWTGFNRLFAVRSGYLGSCHNRQPVAVAVRRNLAEKPDRTGLPDTISSNSIRWIIHSVQPSLNSDFTNQLSVSVINSAKIPSEDHRRPVSCNSAYRHQRNSHRRCIQDILKEDSRIWLVSIWYANIHISFACSLKCSFVCCHDRYWLDFNEIYEFMEESWHVSSGSWIVQVHLDLLRILRPNQVHVFQTSTDFCITDPSA